MRPEVVLCRCEVRAKAKAILGVALLLFVGSSPAFAQASAEPPTPQSMTSVGDQDKQLADQVAQLQKQIASLQADIDPAGAVKNVSAKSGMKMSPAPNKGMGMMAGDKSKMGMPPGKAPMTSGSAAMPTKDDQGEMKGMSPTVNSSMSPPTPAPATIDGMSGGPREAAAAGGMGAEMGEMLNPPRKEIYPSLMAVPDDATPAMRAGIEQVALERMKEGTARISAGLEKLSGSTVSEDYAGMQQAAAQMREGLAEFEAGIAARRMLAEGKAPRNLALDWFKREMNLASPIGPGEPRVIVGVTRFHLFTMALLIAFALAMVAMYFFKMRRAAALFGRVDSEAKAASPGGKAAPNSPAKPAAGMPASAPVPSANGATAAAAPVADSSKTAGRADELWKARGRPFGSPKIDWLRAEEELATEAGNPSAAPPAGASPAAPATPPTVTAAAS